jgi:hypothetical protein
MDDLSPWLKLWWKGTDISAQVISTTVSAGIVWLFADRFIEGKHRKELALDEKKRHQKEKLDREYRDAEVAVKRREKIGEALEWLHRHLQVEAASFVFQRLEDVAVEISRDAELDAIAEFRSYKGFWDRFEG